MGSGVNKRRLHELAAENARLQRELEKPLDQRLREAQDELDLLRERQAHHGHFEPDEGEEWEQVIERALEHLHADLVRVCEALNIPRPECYPSAPVDEGRAERAEGA